MKNLDDVWTQTKLEKYTPRIYTQNGKELHIYSTNFWIGFVASPA